MRHPVAAPTLHVLDRRRDRAERLLNGVRAGVLLLLGAAVLAYAALVTFFISSGRLPLVLSPVAASARPSVSPLDEGAKLLLLALAAAVATYATHWQEELARSFARAAHEREQLEGRLARAQ